MPFSVLFHSVYDSFKKLMYFAKDIMARVCIETKVKSCRTNNKKVVGRNFENKKRRSFVTVVSNLARVSVNCYLGGPWKITYLTLILLRRTHIAVA